MLYYLYDGSFDGLLTAIYEAYYRREIPDQILFQDDYQENLLVRKVSIETDRDKGKKVYDSIKAKISGNALRNVFYAFLTEKEDSGTWIYHYLRLGWKIGQSIDNYITRDEVAIIHDMVQKIKREIHFHLGLTRFRALDHHTYYAPIEPDYNIIGLIAPHFAKRLSDQNWMIHDVARGITAVYNQREWLISDISINKKIVYEKEEMAYQELWKTYFDSIAIKSRINPKLQKRNMPMKYWRYLVEKENQNPRR